MWDLTITAPWARRDWRRVVRLHHLHYEHRRHRRADRVEKDRPHWTQLAHLPAVQRKCASDVAGRFHPTPASSALGSVSQVSQRAPLPVEQAHFPGLSGVDDDSRSPVMISSWPGGRVRWAATMDRGSMRTSANMHTRSTTQAAVVVGALGVVFGDIGTSPIYTVQTVFNPSDPHPVAVSSDSVYGIISLIFWSVMIIVTLTYVTLIMRADNDGEGGIMALITLISRQGAPGGRRAALVLAGLGIFGASLFFGDSMITPAISVLSAVEGLKIIEPSLESLIVPITAVIIIVLFAFQRAGTAAVGRLFGPVMIIWFLAIGACGIAGIVAHPEILRALSPTYALSFLVGNFSIAFFALAGVVLAVTGARSRRFRRPLRPCVLPYCPAPEPRRPEGTPGRRRG
jgi:K+ potassium transporter